MSEIRYDDFFDPSGREEFVQVIKDLQALTVAAKEFNQTVTSPNTQRFEATLQLLTGEISNVAKATRDLNLSNQEHQKQLVSLVSKQEELLKKTEQLNQAKRGAKDIEQALAGSVDALNQKLREQIKSFNALDQSTEKGHVQGEKLAATIRKTKEEIRDLTSKTNITTKTFKAAAGSYNELDQITKQLIKDYKSLGDIEGANKDRAEALSKQIFDNTAKLKQYDATLNQNFRNVGNYKSAFSGLGNSVNQLTREFPAFTNSIQTGLLALSNNIPILADDISKINAALKASRIEAIASADAQAATATATALAGGASEEAASEIGNLAKEQALAAAEATRGPGLFKQLASSIFSFGTALSVGITILTVYGKQIFDFIAGLFGASEGINQAKINLEAYNDVVAEGNKQAASQIVTLDRLYQAATDANRPLDERNRAVRELQSQFPSYFANLDTEIIKNGQAKKSYEQLRTAIIASARAKAAEGKLAENEGKILDLEQEKEKVNNATSNEKARAGTKSTTVNFNQVGTNVGFLKQRNLLPQNFDASGLSTKELLNLQDQVAAEKERDVIEQRRVKALGEIDTKLKSVSATSKFLSQFVNSPVDPLVAQQAAGSINGLNDKLNDLKNRYNALSPAAANYKSQAAGIIKDIKATETELKRLNDAISIKPDRSAERALEKAVKRKDDLLQASAKYEIQLAEQVYIQSAQRSTDEIQLETKRRDILVSTADLRLKLYKQDTREYQNILAEQLKAENDYAKKVVSIRDKDLQQQEQFSQAALEGQYQFREQNYDEQIEFEQKSLEIAIASYNARLGLYRTDSDEYRAILDQKEKAERDYTKRVQQIEIERQNKINSIRQVNTETAQIQVEGQIGVKVAKREITPEDADRMRFEARQKYIDLEITRRQAALATLKEGDQRYYDFQEEIARLNQERVKNQADYELSQAELVHEKKKALEQAAYDFAAEAANQLFELGRANSENNIAELQAEKDKELAVAGNNAVARRRIEENYQKEIGKLKRKQAIFDKIQALFNIGLNTAQGVTSALASVVTAPLVPFIIATGALQAAVVLAKPIPSYFVGRGRTGRKEVAETNEQGFELIQDERGRYRIANSGKRGYTMLEGQEKVFTHTESKKIIREMSVEKQDSAAYVNSLAGGNRLMRSVERRREEQLMRIFATGQMSESSYQRAMEKAIDGMPVTVIEGSDKGLRKFTRTLHARVEDMNARNEMFGNG